MIGSMHALTGLYGDQRTFSSPNQIRKAAQEFEAQLLATLLAPLTQSLSNVPGEPASAGSEQYGFLGAQALASALSSAGGIGIADLLVRRLGNEGGGAGEGEEALHASSD